MSIFEYSIFNPYMLVLCLDSVGQWAGWLCISVAYGPIVSSSTVARFQISGLMPVTHAKASYGPCPSHLTK